MASEVCIDKGMPDCWITQISKNTSQGKNR